MSIGILVIIEPTTKYTKPHCCHVIFFGQIYYFISVQPDKTSKSYCLKYMLFFLSLYTK